jgi:Baseplate J-like protein
METVHVYVVPESKRPSHPDYVALSITTLCSLFLITVMCLSLFALTPTREVSFSLSVTGFSLAPVSKTLNVTALASGKRYIAATTATGTITFYNGAIYTQIIPVGTILQGKDGITVITNEQAAIPPATQTIPPTYGQVNVSAHALSPGASGNIAAGDVNEACCVTSVIAQNPYAFIGGKDEQSYMYITKQDVSHAVAPLLTTLEAQVPQLFPSLALSPKCVPTVSEIPAIGQRVEKVSVSVTVSCTAISYNPQSVRNAIHVYSSHFGQGSFTTSAYQVIAIGKNNRITFFVTATWKPFVARHLFSGK